MAIASSYTAAPITTTTQVTTTSGVFGKFVCKSSSSGTLTLYDTATAATSGTKLLDAFPLTTGTVYNFDIAVGTGIYIVIGGTAAGSALYV